MLADAVVKRDLVNILHVLAFSRINVNQLYEINGKKQSILHHACATSSREVVEFLIRNGGDLEKLNEDKYTPGEVALNTNNVRSIGKLF